ncbi:MAG: ABC transporter substrate-binding protein [Crenarchaeota archaeon]|nr:ABC transporter substrate-binding protein [Thermoproteota archaeon]
MKSYAALLLLTLLAGGVAFAMAPQEKYGGPSCDYIKMAIERAGGLEKVKEGLGTTTIKIGALIPMSGALASFAEERYAAQLAVRDLNYCFEQLQLPFKIELYIEDTQTMPQVALEKARKLVNVNGVHMIVGPATSAAVGTLQDVINNELKVILMSHSSTSPLVRFNNREFIKNNGYSYVFFSVSSDLFQARALASVVESLGYKNVVFFYRNDDYGKGFAMAFKQAFEEMGGKAHLIPYDPNARSYLAELRAIPTYNPDAIVWLAFDEIKVILKQALTLGLQKYPWFFTEAVKGPALVADPVVAKVLATKNVLGTAVYTTSNFIQYYESVYGRAPVEFSDTLYDAVWLVTLGALRAGCFNPNVMSRAIIEMSYVYKGFSGDKSMNAIYQEPLTTSYSIWTVRIVDGKPVFVDVGFWSPDKGLVMKENITPR